MTAQYDYVMTMNPSLCRAMIMNVNEPETRGVALALHVVLDDLGKGLGPAIVALLITALGRQLAFSLSIAGWIPCGLCICECPPCSAMTGSHVVSAFVTVPPVGSTLECPYCIAHPGDQLSQAKRD